MTAGSAGTRNILVVGGGACGGFHGARLAAASSPDAPVSVSVVCRSNFSAVRDHGFVIKQPNRSPVVFRPANVFPTTSDAFSDLRLNTGHRWDHVMVFAKATADDGAAILGPMFDAASSNVRTVSLWQNGIGIERDVAARLSLSKSFDSTGLVSTVMYVAMTLESPQSNVITAADQQRAALGLYSRNCGVICEQEKGLNDLAGLLKRAELNATVTQDIQAARWHKNLWNASIGLLGLVGGCADSQLVLDTQTPVVRALMNEIAATGEAVLGRKLPYDELGTVDDLIALTRAIGAYRASILVDWVAGRSIEHQALFGSVIDAARDHGVSVPRLETLYAAVRLMLATRGSS